MVYYVVANAFLTSFGLSVLLGSVRISRRAVFLIRIYANEQQQKESKESLVINACEYKVSTRFKICAAHAVYAQLGHLFNYPAHGPALSAES